MFVASSYLLLYCIYDFFKEFFSPLIMKSSQCGGWALEINKLKAIIAHKMHYLVGRNTEQRSSGGGPEASARGGTIAEKKKGSIVGAVSLIVGTSIGSGILALPRKTSPAGFIPSAAAMILCWLFLLIEALLLAEINVYLWKKTENDEEEDELKVVSLRTMAQEMLGEWGGNVATITYLFLAYTSIVAYTSKSGEVLSHLINLPDSTSGIIFTFLISALIFVGGTHITDQVNQWLTVSMIGLLVAIEVTQVSSSDSSSLMAMPNWFKVPSTIPVIIFSLVYHDIAPVVCAYLGGDLMRIRLSILLGSCIPLLTLLVWDDIALSSHNSDGKDLLDMLVSAKSRIMLPVIEVFSLLAVGTSLIGTLLGFSEFFKEQLEKKFPLSYSIQLQEFEGKENSLFERKKAILRKSRNWWKTNKISFFATSMAIAPSVIISTILPDAFSIATDIAGGYCMTILYGILPPMMAWEMQSRVSSDDSFQNDRDMSWNAGPTSISNVKPVLIGAGLFSCLIIIIQISQY